MVNRSDVMVLTDDTRSKRTAAYVEAELMLPHESHQLLEQLVAEYRFASLKHHGRMFASPKVIAELILMGWRSLPLPPAKQ